MDTSEIIYHYTDAKGLFGILDTKQIWASSYRYMNDAQEFYYGFDLISEIIPSQLPFLPSNFSDYPVGNFTNIIKNLKLFYDLDIIFVASFSVENEGDSLNQWRGYAGLHSGYSLGFSRENMNSINLGTRLIKCSYDKEEQLNKIRKIIDKYLSAAIAELRSGSHDDFGEFVIYSDHARIAAQEMALLSPELKHDAFSEEKEWRLVVGPLLFNDERICYRDSERGIIPYFKIDFNATALKHIIVGPGPNKERNELSLRQMLKSKGFENVKVSVSKIPFRTW